MDLSRVVPSIFADGETLETAARRAETDGRRLLVDVTDNSKPIVWATLYTTWRDPELVEWVETNAVAIQVDVCADADTARALGVRPGRVPVVLLLLQRRIWGVYRGVAAIHRSLRATGRETEAAAVREAALQFEDSARMRAAVA